MRNLGQRDFALLANYTPIKIIIVSAIGLDFFSCQDNANK